MKKLNCRRLLALSLLVAASASAKTITVNTADNTDFGAGKTNLVTAIRALADGDTIAFNIPGPTSQVHYLLTPVDGYPLITSSSVTIDGYSQPGAVPNSNPIHAANNAQLKIVLSSTNGNAMAIARAAQDFVNSQPSPYTFERPGFNANDNCILGFFRGTNSLVKGLVFQGVCGNFTGGTAYGTVSYYKGAPGPLMGICYMSDGPYSPYANMRCQDWQVSGCWFGLDPATGQPAYVADGSLATPIHGIDIQRHRNQAQTLVNYAQPGTFGVKAGSLNPRAEFNVFVGPVAAVLTGLNYRICGNFLNVLPDGMHNFDLAFMPQADASLQTGNGDAMFIFARQVDNMLIGTDGDGVNDDQEGNVFGGMSAYPFSKLVPNNGYSWFDAFYNPSPSTPTQATNVVVAGNYFGVAVDGVTRFTNSTTVWAGFSGTGDYRFGSDFDGVSDALEANLIYNNYPFSTEFPDPITTDYTPNAVLSGRDTQNFTPINPGARVSFRGNVTVGNDLLPYKYANSLSSQLTPFTNYSNPYLDVTSPNGIIPTLSSTNIFPHITGTFAPGINGYTTVQLDVYELDPEGWENGKLFNEAELLNALGTYDGFPQGQRYLGSVTVPNTGSFDIILPTAAGKVTVTANYSKDAVGTHNGKVHTSNFSNPGYVFPGGASSVGVTQIVPDVACWFDTVANAVTNGPIILANQPLDPSSGLPKSSLGNWEPYISVVGDSTFLIEFNTFATNLLDGFFQYQNNVVAKQPANGGPAKLDYCFYGDDGKPVKGIINYSRQNGNPGRVAGDPRYGASKFITEAEVSIGQIPAFQSVPRWGNNDIYQGTGLRPPLLESEAGNRYCGEQIFSLDPYTLAQTPVTNAWDYVYGNFVGSVVNTGNKPQLARTGGRCNFLDNGNIVVMIDDKTGITTAANEVTTFAIIQPNGTIVKGPTLAKNQDIFDNMCAVKGGFVIRVHNSLLIYDNNGSLTFSNDVRESSGMPFSSNADAGGRGDKHRIGGNIHSYFVFMAGNLNAQDNATNTGVAAWDTRTGQFAGSAIVTDGDPAVQQSERTDVAVDALNRVCVTWMYKPDKNAAFGYQAAARVAQFDGAKFNWLTHTFFPFVNHDQDPTATLGYVTQNPVVAMTTRQICFAAKGKINNANNVAAGPNTPDDQQTVYTVISHPAPVAAPKPTMTITKSGSDVIVNWKVEDGLFTVQTKSTLGGTWANATAGNVAPPVSLPIGAGSQFIRLAR